MNKSMENQSAKRKIRRVMVLFVMLFFTILPVFGNSVSAASKAERRAAKLLKIAEGEIRFRTRAVEEKTKYEKEMFGSNGSLWCASFVSWCAEQAGISRKVIPRTRGTLVMAESAGKFYRPWSMETWNTLKRGDVIFFSPRKYHLRYKDGSKAVHHVGIVKDFDKKKGMLYTVEGNVSRLRKNGTIDHRYRVVRSCVYRLKAKTGGIKYADNPFFIGEYICGCISVR